MTAVPVLLTTADLARMLGISPMAVIRRRFRGTLPPAIKVGGTLRWDAEDIRAWLDANKSAHRKASPSKTDA